MNTKDIKTLFSKHKENSLYHRYITNDNIEPLLEKFKKNLNVNTIGRSVLGQPIYSIKVGSGEKKILMWSQMHGNESTTTKAVFDLLNTLLHKDSNLNSILEACTLCIIPILSPDGAKNYTRVNANSIDLNRDAQDLSQPESKILRAAFNEFEPDFCYNLHGQRTIFSVGTTNKPATVSFLAPAQDKEASITSNRKVAMEIISKMNEALQEFIPNQVGVYDDAFNLNCVGDTFQSKNVPTILFEAGHYPNDYERECTREYIYISLMASLDYISKNHIIGGNYKPYFKIPKNGKHFFDVVIRNVKVKARKGDAKKDIGILYVERLINDKIEFIPRIEKIANLSHCFGHKEIDAEGVGVFNALNEPLKIGYENDFVIMNNDKISLIQQ